MRKKKNIKGELSEFEIVDKFDDDDLYDDCPICQAEKFRNKYDRYPSLPELIEFLKTNKKPNPKPEQSTVQGKELIEK